MGPFAPHQLRELLPDAAWLRVVHPPEAAETAERGAAGPAEGIDQALDFYQRSYLTSDILVKVDRASMLHSLEVRAPFLDTALAEFVNGLPPHFKYHRGTTKRLLKQAVVASGLLPKWLAQRRKKGFGIPVARWMRVELHDYFRHALVEQFPDSLGMFDRRAILRLWEEHNRREVNRYKELWALFMLAQWADHRFQRRVPTELLNRSGRQPALARPPGELDRAGQPISPSATMTVPADRRRSAS